MTADNEAQNEFDAAVSQLGETAAYWVDRAFVYGLAKPGDRPPYEWARTVVAQLTSDDEYEAAGAAQTVVEWIDTESEEWWESPLGRLVERQTAPLEDEEATVTTGQAASLLEDRPLRPEAADPEIFEGDAVPRRCRVVTCRARGQPSGGRER